MGAAHGQRPCAWPTLKGSYSVYPMRRAMTVQPLGVGRSDAASHRLRLRLFTFIPFRDAGVVQDDTLNAHYVGADPSRERERPVKNPSRRTSGLIRAGSASDRSRTPRLRLGLGKMPHICARSFSSRHNSILPSAVSIVTEAEEHHTDDLAGVPLAACPPVPLCESTWSRSRL